MRITCALTSGKLTSPAADLIVFPEGVCWKEIQAAQSSYSKSVIVGAVIENGQSREVLLHQGLNRIDYLKVQTDGQTTGNGDPKQDPVYYLENLCIGVLICMDIDAVEFSGAVIKKIRSSRANLKLLCIPADMASCWDILAFPKRFEGIHVILCNHTKTYQGSARCQSFIADAHGRKIVVQVQDEPIYAGLA